MVEKTPKQRQGALKREVFEWIRSIAIALSITLFVVTLIAQPITVLGSSMENTLHDKELMIVTKFEYILGEPERFDVVICRYPGRGSTNFVKRIVGIPGDTVAVFGGTLYVNGEAVEEDYIDYRADYVQPEITVEEGHYFVLGDNRASSNDSHIGSVGQLTRDQIVGKVRFIVWPLPKIRAIE